MTKSKNLLKQLNRAGATALLLVSSLSPATNLVPAHKVAAQTKVAQSQTIDSVSQTPDYGKLTGDGTTAAQDFKAQVITDTFGSGTLTSVAGNFVSNQAPSGTGTAVGLVPVVPTISNTGAAVLTSNDNAHAIGGISNSLLAGNYTSAKNGASGGATVTLNGAVDWTKDFSLKYNIQGQGADGSKGSGFGVAFVPLSPETFETYLDGNAVAFAAGGTVYPTLAAPNLNSLFTNSIAAAIPNSFYFGEKGNATGNIGFHYADMTSFGTGSYKPTDAGFTTKTNYNFFDPTNPGKGFAWGTGTSSGLVSSGTAPSASGDAVQSGFAWSATPTTSTVPEVFNVDYQMTYTASTRTLTVTPYVAGTSTPVSMAGAGMIAYGTYGGFATPSYTTKIASKLVGQTYSIAGLRMWNGITGVGTATGAPSYVGQPQTTQMTFLSYNFASTTANVTVNYQDTTGATIKPSTTIRANVFATLGVTGISPDSANDTWTWAPASIAGYAIQSANDVEVSSTAANNQLTLVYAKSVNPATTNWTFQYDSSAQNPPALPNAITQSGVVGDSITTPSITLPTGYTISSVLGADGKTYSSVSGALSAYPTMTQATNNFVITLTPISQTANFIFSFDSSHANDPAQPALPNTISENGLTGSPITDLSAQLAAVIPAGYQISAVNHQGKTYPDLPSALTVHPNYTAGAGDNDFTLVLTFSGTLTLNVPNTIDFGLHNVTSQTQKLKGSLDKELSVTDSRNSATITNWSLSVQETSPIQEVDSSGNPVANGVSFEGSLYFGGNQMTQGKVVMIHSEYSLTTGTFDISSNWTGQQGFWLTATVAQQKAGTNFQGSLTWTLSQTP